MAATLRLAPLYLLVAAVVGVQAKAEPLPPVEAVVDRLAKVEAESPMRVDLEDFPVQ